jgi:hypothetical protein
MGACRGVECSSKSAGEGFLQGNVANPAPVLHNSLLLTSVVYSLEVKLDNFPHGNRLDKSSLVELCQDLTKHAVIYYADDDDLKDFLKTL